MKILIIYATRGGVSRQCAHILGKHLEETNEVDIFSIDDEKLPATPDGYDVAVLGGSIRMGALNRKLKKYIKINREKLSSMPCSVFMCCGLIKDFEDYVTTQLPSKLKCSLEKYCFGGELKPEKLKGLDKWLVRIIRQSIIMQDPDKFEDQRYELPEILDENIAQLAQKIKSLK